MAGHNMSVLFLVTDPPEQKNTSFLELFIETALFVVAPHVMAFAKAKRFSEATKALYDDAELVLNTMKSIPETMAKSRELQEAKQEAKRTSHGAIELMKGVDRMLANLAKEQALIRKVKLGRLQLLPVKSKQADAVFDGIDWKTPPGLLGEKFGKLQSVLEYMLARHAVVRSVAFKLLVWAKDFEKFSTADKVLTVTPIGISQLGLDTIYERCNIAYGGAELGADIPGAPAT